MRKKAIVIHSGGMDSSICLALAKQEWGKENILSLTFFYQQRHSIECERAKKICLDWDIDHVNLDIDCLQKITTNALMDSNLSIEQEEGKIPNTWVVGRNGLMARLGAIQAHHLGAQQVYMGIMSCEGSTSGYPDCSRDYMDLMEKVLQMDLVDPQFKIHTPLVHMSKKESLVLANKLGVLDYLLRETVTCYEGIPQIGCGVCPSCRLRHEGVRQFVREYPYFENELEGYFSKTSPSSSH
jgi:7-cyano-7-deazaguanine synthase